MNESILVLVFGYSFLFEINPDKINFMHCKPQSQISHFYVPFPILFQRWMFFLFFVSLVQIEISLTWLNESHIQYFVHLTVVSGDVEYAFGWILYACYINWYQILGDLLPFNCTGTAGRYMKHFRPQPEYTNEMSLSWLHKTIVLHLNISSPFQIKKWTTTWQIQ